MFVTVPEIPASLTLQGEQHRIFDLTVLVTFLNVLLNFGPPVGILECPFLLGVSEHGQYHLGLLPVWGPAFNAFLGIRRPEGVCGS